MSQLQTSSVIWSLENVREKVTQRLTNVPEYRAFLAIEMPIAELRQIPDLLAHLETAQQKILNRLNLTREYQSLLTVDKTIEEISEVLEFLGEESVVGLTAFLQESFASELLAS
jgi:hypothetical protein